MATVIPLPSTSTNTPSGPAAMTWLEIARRVRKEAGLSGDDTDPSSVAGQEGEMLSVINWVSSAWLRIQGRRKWDWLWEPETVTILAGENSATGTISAERYVLDATWAGTRQLEYMPWAEFRQAYPASQIADGDPDYWSIRPDRAFVVSSKPTADLEISVERYVNPTTIGEDDEYPAMPGHQHMAIVWRAVMLYAGFDEAGSLYQHAKTEFGVVMGEAVIDDIPTLMLGAPLC